MALVLSLGYILQRGTLGIPDVERLRMLYGMIDKIRADLVKLTVEDIYARPLLMDEETRTGSVFKAL